MDNVVQLKPPKVLSDFNQIPELQQFFYFQNYAIDTHNESAIEKIYDDVVQVKVVCISTTSPGTCYFPLVKVIG